LSIWFQERALRKNGAQDLGSIVVGEKYEKSINGKTGLEVDEVPKS
jgi:hypothetical protein